MTTLAGLSRRHAIFAGLATAAAACSARAVAPTQPRRNLYDCDGCEAATEKPARGMSWTARIASPREPGEPMVLEGIVFSPDGKTPAPGVVIYAHQTDATGIYRGGSARASGSARHGVLHAWVRTDERGRYRFETIKPAPYPNRQIPAHVHLYIAERGRRPYYIDDVVFSGESWVDAKYRAAQELRGGSGIISLARTADGRLLARRDIVLERHP